MGDLEEEKLLFFPSCYDGLGAGGADLYAVAAMAPAAAGGGGGEKAAPRRRRRKARAAAAEEELRKRRLSDEQVKYLELSFERDRKLETGRKVQLAAELGLEPKQVAVWFQNRRARHKSKLVEEEYARLRAQHDAVVVEKCHLQNEVEKLKERLAELEEEMRKLAVSGGARDGSSPSTSFSTITVTDPFAAAAGYHQQAASVDFTDLMNDPYSYSNYYMMEMDLPASYYGGL